MFTETMVTMRCGKCWIEWGVPNGWQKERLRTGEDFYCPNGHCRVYRDTEEDQLRKKLERSEERERIARAETQGERLKKEKAERKLKRVTRGVCPDCNRSFINLKRHMKTTPACSRYGELFDQFRRFFTKDFYTCPIPLSLPVPGAKPGEVSACWDRDDEQRLEAEL